jgi:hypothetical protein
LSTLSLGGGLVTSDRKKSLSDFMFLPLRRFFAGLGYSGVVKHERYDQNDSAG